MAVRGIEQRIHLPRRSASRTVEPLELWPGIVATVKAAVANSRARRDLAGSSAMADRGRATGARI